MAISENNSHREMRFLSIQKIITAFQNGATSKNDIRILTGLSWGSCNTIINLLNEKGVLVQKLDTEIERRGRKTTSYSFTKKEFLIYGFELKTKEILCSIATLGKEEIFRKTYTLKNDLCVDNVYDSLNNVYVKSLMDAELESQSILGISIALAGGVDTTKNIWVNSPRISRIDNFDFNKIFEQLPEINYHFIEHDIHAQASSVLHSNKWNNENYVFVHLGEGVSLSIFNKGVFLGHRGFAGEIGFIPYNYKGSLQNNKIIESAISKKGIIDFVNQNFGEHIKSISEIKPYILEDEKYIEHIFEVVKFMLIVITNIIDPEAIIIGGVSIETIKPTLISRIEDNLREETWLGGPKMIKWYDNKDMFGAYGTIINSNEAIVNKFIREYLL